MQGAKKIIFTACHPGKLKLAFTSPDVISTSPKSFLTSRIYFTVLLLLEFLKKHHLPVGQIKNHLPVGQVKNRIHQPDSKIHQPWAIGHCFLCTLCMSRGYWCFKSLLFSSHYLVLDRWILAKLCFVRPIKFHDLACFERTFCTKIAYQGDLTVV